MSPPEIIMFYKGILTELSETRVGRLIPDNAIYAYPGAIVTQRWIDTTKRRLKQLQNKVPHLSPNALRTKLYRERKKNGQLVKAKEKLNDISKVKRTRSNKES